MRAGTRQGTISALLAAITLAVAGCGGGSSTASTTQSAASTASQTTPKKAPTPAEARFIARADAVCRKNNAEILSMHVSGGSAAEIERVVPRTVKLEQDATLALARLRPPASLAAAWQSMLGYRKTLADELENLLGVAKRKETAPLKALAAAKRRAHNGLSETAKTNGFKDCARVGSIG